MNRYIAEVIAAHVAIENWLNQGDGSADALMRRFSPDFTMIRYTVCAWIIRRSAPFFTGLAPAVRA
ncbi:putative cytoplasmic protein [Klebsiella michiganensis]|nr:putative cytoplasmic protein [Klebsiella michiganensis]